MSTRTRIILKVGNETLTGAKAIVRLLQLTVPRGFMSMEIPVDFKKLSKRERLIWLAGKLPPKSKLILFQEPKRTRLNKSIYWKVIKEMPPPPAVNKQQPRDAEYLPANWGQ